MIAAKRHKKHKKDFLNNPFCELCAFLRLFFFAFSYPTSDISFNESLASSAFLFASSFAVRMLQLRIGFMNQIAQTSVNK